MAFLKCNTTTDCVRLDPLVPRFCFENPISSREKFICDCNVDYGWKGEGCDETSEFIIFQRIYSVILLILSLVLITLISRSIVLNYIYEGFSTSFLALTSYSALCASICIMCYAALRFQPIYDPTYFKFQEFNSFVLKEPIQHIVPKNILSALFFRSMGITFLIISSICLILSWHEIFQKISAHESFHNAKKARAQKRTVQIISIFSILFMTFLVSISDKYGAIYTSVVLCFLAVIFCVFVSQEFINSLSQVSSYYGKEKTLEITIKYVRKIRLGIIGCTIIIFISILIFATTVLEGPNKIAPGDFHIAFVAKDFALFTSLIELCIIAWYVNSVSVGPIVSEEYFPRICGIFGKWDKMNSRIIPEDQETTFVSETDNIQTPYFSNL